MSGTNGISECLPYLYCFIIASGRDTGPIRRPCNGTHCARVTVIDVRCVPCSYIPDANSLILTSRSDEFSTGRPRYCRYFFRMTTIGIESITHARIPYLNSLVSTAGNDLLVIW